MKVIEKYEKLEEANKRLAKLGDREIKITIISDVGIFIVYDKGRFEDL